MLYLRDFAKLLFPTYCSGCRTILVEGEVGICLKCQVNLPRLHLHDFRGNILEKKFWGRADIQMATAFLKMTKKSVVRRMIHELKYHDNKNTGVVLGKLFGTELLKSRDMRHFDYIIPVPLHPKKHFLRGYNQCDYIAQGLSEIMNIPMMPNNLIRTHHNDSQTRKSNYERWENVEGIFSVKRIEDLSHRKILLIDDIITTGSTIESCASALRKIPELKLSIAALAIADS